MSVSLINALKVCNQLMPEALGAPARPINGGAPVYCCDLHSFIRGLPVTVPVLCAAGRLE